MADDEQDDSQKTEDPTAHRLEEAAKRGQIVFSRELLSFLAFFTFTLIVAWYGSTMVKELKLAILPFITAPDSIPITEKGISADSIGMSHIYKLFLVPMCAILFMVLAGGLLQTRFNTSTEPLKPSLERISIMKGFKRLFSSRSLVEFFKGMIKMTITAFICYLVIKPYFHQLTLTHHLELESSAGLTFEVIIKIMIWVTVAMGFLAVFDYLYQRYEYMKSLRMSLQEIKEEYRQQEGDPHVKSKLKQIRAERARKRMMQNVPKADVVITNPTHFAVALKYDQKAMAAPILIAKGADKLAAKIRETATMHKIPIVSNPPLARALYDEVDLDEQIPIHHYKAVAEVIGFVYKMKKKKPTKPRL